MTAGRRRGQRAADDVVDADLLAGLAGAPRSASRPATSASVQASRARSERRSTGCGRRRAGRRRSAAERPVPPARRPSARTPPCRSAPVPTPRQARDVRSTRVRERGQSRSAAAIVAPVLTSPPVSAPSARTRPSAAPAPADPRRAGRARGAARARARDARRWRTSGRGRTGRASWPSGRRRSAHKMIFHPPLYPYFLAGPYALTGSFAAAQALQVVVAALLVPAVGRVGARDPRAARPGAGRGRDHRLLSRARLVLRATSGSRTSSWSCCGGRFERLLAADRDGARARCAGRRRVVGGGGAGPRDRALLPARGRGVARAPARARRRSRARRGARSPRPCSPSRPGRTGTGSPSTPSSPCPRRAGRTCSRATRASRATRPTHGGRGPGPDRAVPLRARHGAGGDPRAPAGLDLREARASRCRCSGKRRAWRSST